MTIQHNFPASLREPAIYHQFDFTSQAGGLQPEDRNVCLVGIKSSAGTATASQPVEFFDESDSDGKFGVGSELALMARAALKTARLMGASPRLWGLPCAAPSGAAAAETLTVTGPATASGDIRLRIAGRTILVGVTSGDVQNTIATAIKNALDAAASDLPVTAAVSTNVVTATHRHNGVSGNDVTYEVVSTPAGVSIALAQSVAGSGAVSYATPLDSLQDKRYQGIAIGQHTSTDVTALKDHLDESWSAKRWGFGYVGSTGTLSASTTLASGANKYDIVLCGCEGCPNLPAELAASVATMVESQGRPNYNFDGVELPLYPPAASLVWGSGAGGELESALSGGVTPLVPTTAGDRLQVVRLLTSETTYNSAPFENLRDVANSRTVAYMAYQLDTVLRLRFKGALIDTAAVDDVLGVIYDVLKAAETQRYLKNVDDHFQELMGEIDIASPTRIVASVPEAVVQNLHSIIVVHRLFVEA